MGWNCGLLALAAFYLASISKNRRSRWLLHLILAAAILLLILTKSRMALISTVAALLFFWMMASSRHNKAGIILGFISISCMAYLFLGDHIFQYLEAATTLGRGEYAKESIGTLTGRLPLWQECFRWSAMKPFLGYGFNTFISPVHYASIALNVGWTPSSIHSGYIDAVMGLGYTGFVMLVSILCMALIKAIMLAKRFLSYSFVAATLIWLCYNLFLEANLITRPTFMTFIILTILVHLAFLPEEKLVHA
jgi:O-antigen ligase